MTYQLAVDISSRLAAIAPVCGSFHAGFNLAPEHGVPVMDIHGNRDTTVPANTTYAGDGCLLVVRRVSRCFAVRGLGAIWARTLRCEAPNP